MRLLVLLAFIASACPAAEQQFATLRNLRLDGGETIPECRIGFRTIGALNAGRSNAVLFPTWFSGRSSDLEQFVGPGKMLDPSRNQVILVDALANGVSCSPSNSQGAFPRITIGDMVHSQYRLLTEHLGIRRLHAVIGISMGGMQTFEWIVRYPAFASRAVPIVGSPRLASIDLLLWQAELSAIEEAARCKCDPRAAMRAVYAIHQFALTTPSYRSAETPASRFSELKAQIDKSAAEGMDPADWASQLRAMMSHDVARAHAGSLEKAASSVRARLLVVAATQDHMVNPLSALAFAKSAGAPTLELASGCGHLAPSCESDRLEKDVAAFLSN